MAKTTVHSSHQMGDCFFRPELLTNPVRHEIRGVAFCNKCGHAIWGAYNSWNHDVQLETRCRGYKIPKLIAASLAERDRERGEQKERT